MDIKELNLFPKNIFSKKNSLKKKNTDTEVLASLLSPKENQKIFDSASNSSLIDSPSSSSSTLIDIEIIPPRGNVSDYILGQTLGNYFHVGDKPGGVEPGFLAIAINQDFITYINQDQDFQKQIFTHKFANPEEFKTFAKKQASYTQNNNIKTALKTLAEKLRSEGMGKRPVVAGRKLNLLLVKQDYQDPEGPFDWVAPPPTRLAQTNAMKSIPPHLREPAIKIYHSLRLCPPSKENTNAILECIANKIAGLHGMKVQEQNLLFSEYHIGLPKIMTISKWEPNLEMIEGCLAGSKSKKDYENYFVEVQRDAAGKISKNAAGNPTPLVDENNKYKIDASITNLGENLPLAIEQGDRDFFGSKLQNKGRMLNELFGIDFGHCYRGKNVLIKTLQDDFSFIQPKEENKKIKNISVFYDTLLSDRMAGMFFLYQGADQDIRDKIFNENEKERIETVIKEYEKVKPGFKQRFARVVPECLSKTFDEYLLLFKALANKEPKNSLKQKEFLKYVKEIETAKNLAIGDRTSMLKIFKQRMLLNPQEVDLLDNLEKLTSNTSEHSSDGKVALQHLRVLSTDKTRWQMKKEEGLTIITATLNNGTKSKATLEKLQKYFQKYNPGSVIYGQVGNNLEIKVNTDFLLEFSKVCSEENILEFKKNVSKRSSPRNSTDKAVLNRLSTNDILHDPTYNADLTADIDSIKSLLDDVKTELLNFSEKCQKLPSISEEIGEEEHKIPNFSDAITKIQNVTAELKQRYNAFNPVEIENDLNQQETLLSKISIELKASRVICELNKSKETMDNLNESIGFATLQAKDIFRSYQLYNVNPKMSSEKNKEEYQTSLLENFQQNIQAKLDQFKGEYDEKAKQHMQVSRELTSTQRHQLEIYKSTCDEAMSELIQKTTELSKLVSSKDNTVQSLVNNLLAYELKQQETHKTVTLDILKVINPIIYRHGDTEQKKTHLKLLGHTPGMKESYLLHNIGSNEPLHYFDFLKQYAPRNDVQEKDSTLAFITKPIKTIANFFYKIAPKKLPPLLGTSKSGLFGRKTLYRRGAWFNYLPPLSYRKFLGEEGLLKPAVAEHMGHTMTETTAMLANVAYAMPVIGDVATMTRETERRIFGRFLGEKKGSVKARLQQAWLNDFEHELKKLENYHVRYNQILTNLVSLQSQVDKENFIKNIIPGLKTLNVFWDDHIAKQERLINVMLKEFTEGEVAKKYFIKKDVHTAAADFNNKLAPYIAQKLITQLPLVPLTTVTSAKEASVSSEKPTNSSEIVASASHIMQ